MDNDKYKLYYTYDCITFKQFEFMAETYYFTIENRDLILIYTQIIDHALITKYFNFGNVNKVKYFYVLETFWRVFEN